MRNFDEFLAGITQQDMEQALKNAMQSAADSDSTYTEKELQLMAKTAQITAVGFRDILRKYHNWLMEQNSE